MRSFPSPRIVRGLEKKGQLSPLHRSPNYAVISLSRPLSPLDRKSSRQESGVCFSGFAWHERFLRVFAPLPFSRVRKHRNRYSERIPKKWGFGFPGASLEAPWFLLFC